MSMIKPISNNDNKTLKNVIRNNLQVFHNFCEKHNLTYYLSDGTLLGAIRHQGMIPWDDDADVCMPRKDYNRLLELSGELPKPYKLGHFSLDPHYIYPFIKFMDSNTEIIEYFGEASYKAGVWVDIFPLDGTYKSIRVRKLHYALVRNLRFLFQLRVRSYRAPEDKTSTIKYWLKKIIKPLLYSIIKAIPKSLIFNQMDFIAKHVCTDKTSVVGNLYTSIGIKASHKKEWFEEKQLVDFDGYKFFSPKGYDGYLTNLYGDYMTPPPENERKQHNIQILK